MENVVNLDSWHDFKNAIETQSADTSLKHPFGSRSTLLFRGQSDSKWELKTTLDRRRDEPFSFVEYFRTALSIKPEIETFTKQEWALPEYDELVEYCKSYDKIWFEFPTYEYLVYLRHHGFPSPLLDWSASPYIAAFFAFNNEPETENVAIYCYQEYAGSGKSSSSNEPLIKSLGPRVKSHPRHYIQQSQYTICAKYEDENWVYCPHEKVFNLGIQNQDKLTKYILPASERCKILSELNVYNINAFSLFQNEDALLKTLAFREYERLTP